MSTEVATDDFFQDALTACGSSKMYFGGFDALGQILGKFASHDLVSSPEEEMHGAVTWVLE